MAGEDTATVTQDDVYEALEEVSEQMKEFVGEIDGVEGVYPKMVFDPPWTPDMMSEDAKFALGY
jgi:metal-sulfur cluster biosynthetic enzyme